MSCHRDQEGVPAGLLRFQIPTDYLRDRHSLLQEQARHLTRQHQLGEDNANTTSTKLVLVGCAWFVLLQAKNLRRIAMECIPQGIR